MHEELKTQYNPNEYEELKGKEIEKAKSEEQKLSDQLYADIKKTYEEWWNRKMENEMGKLKEFSKYSENEVNQKFEKLYNEKWLKRWAQNLKWFQSKMVDFRDVSGSLWNRISNMLSIWEQYIWDWYRKWGWWGMRDCSHFVSKLLSTFSGENMYLTSKWFYDAYKWSAINRNDIRAGDIMYQKGHVEMVVGKPFIENWHTYIMTIWSSTDKYNISPMFDANKNPIKNHDWVWYRKREIFPKNSNKYTFLRPPYESWDGKDS